MPILDDKLETKDTKINETYRNQTKPVQTRGQEVSEICLVESNISSPMKEKLTLPITEWFQKYSS